MHAPSRALNASRSQATIYYSLQTSGAGVGGGGDSSSQSSSSEAVTTPICPLGGGLDDAAAGVGGAAGVFKYEERTDNEETDDDDNDNDNANDGEAAGGIELTRNTIVRAVACERNKLGARVAVSAEYEVRVKGRTTLGNASHTADADDAQTRNPVLS